MMSMQDMFYSNAEPVWIVKPEEKKKDGAKKEEKPVEKQEFSILSIIPNYPYYYPAYVPEPSPKAEPQKKKETTTALHISICCSECVDTITYALKKLPGVKEVDCDILKEKVVVTYTTTPLGDILSESTRAFKHARLWRADD
ncbi:hypothetical protein MPTK1_7g17120 [Marchantia polymorpha subsp. ruderalis]|nr:hypothetical protein MARPO_0051s0049 [Marchantia polymorpha]BBN17821.1 hypothetical protein Mp_7g17120 [Marchantia polymorpha subsp. ruderalis]|eukprot:PTQ38446.1 hypothetical protein MARPO_0051s0049 [Marchantia polymorpha]